MGVIRAMFGSALILLIIFAINIIVIHRTLLNGNYYKDVLDESDIYENSPALISDLISSALEETVEKNIKEQFGNVSNQNVDITNLKNQLNPLIEDSVAALITPELLRETAETNIDNITSFLKGKNEDINIYIPRDTLLNNLKTKAPQIEQDIKDTVNNFPTCNDEQANNLQNAFGESGALPGSQSVVIDCIPANIKASVLEDSHFSIFSNIDQLVAELEKKNPELSRSEFSVSEFIELRKNDEEVNPSDIDEIQNQYSDNRELVQSGFRGSNIAVIGLWGIVISFLIVYALLSKGDMWNKMASALKVTFTASLINLIPAALIKYLLISSTINETNFNKLTDSDLKIDSDSLLSIIKILRELLDNVVTPIVFLSAVICITSLVLIVLFKMISKNEDETGKVIKEINKTEDKAEITEKKQ